MRGLPNHDVLDGAVFAGEGVTPPCWALVDLGAYPGMVVGEQSVSGELYRVDEALLARLDRFEGCPTLYRRARVTLMDGSSPFSYLLQPSVVPAVPLWVPAGDWRARCRGGHTP